jgi:hypothetical protein
MGGLENFAETITALKIVENILLRGLMAVFKIVWS